MKTRNMILTAMLSVVMTGCNNDNDEAATIATPAQQASTDPFAMISPNEAPIISASGKRAGSVTASEDKDGITVALNITEKNVMPTGELGVTINDKGSCGGSDYAESGGHWNPHKREHGPNNPNGFHLGDIGNAFSAIGAANTFKYSAMLSGIGYRNKLARGQLMDSDGFSIIIHEKKDDLKTAPNGGMGRGIACAAFKP